MQVQHLDRAGGLEAARWITMLVEDRAVCCPDIGIVTLLDDDHAIRSGNGISGRRHRTIADEVCAQLLGDDVPSRVDDNDRSEGHSAAGYDSRRGNRKGVGPRVDEADVERRQNSRVW